MSSEINHESTKAQAMVQIRKATPLDAAEIANVHTNSWREAYQGLLPQDYLDDQPLRFKSRVHLWQMVVQQNSSSTYVAEHPEYGIVGFINGGKGRENGSDHQIEIYALYLLRKFHGQKIGYGLMQALFAEVTKRGFTEAYVWVLAGNPTIAFYQRTGGTFNNESKEEQIGGQTVFEHRYHWSSLKI